jgi:DNA-binding transcriptional regulator YiaG
LDFYSQYKFLDESIFGASWFVYRARYAVLGGYGNHQVIAYKNLDDLTAKAHRIAYRITKAEALDLPEQLDVMRPVELEPSALSTYKGIEKQSVAELEQGEVTATNVLTKLLRLSQVTGGFIKSDFGDAVERISQAKLSALDDIVDECVDAGKKLVIFARFLPELDAIEKLLKRKSLHYSLIKGDVKDRAKQVEQFQNEPTIKVFVGQLQTTGMGLTLTAADTAVFYSISYNYADYEQAKARIHRIGQKNNCTYIHLVAKDTIDEKVLTALNNKKNLAVIIQQIRGVAYMETSMLELSDKLMAARFEKQKAEAVLKQANTICDDLESQLIQEMLNAETQSFKRNDVNFCLCNKAQRRIVGCDETRRIREPVHHQPNDFAGRGQAHDGRESRRIAYIS